MSDLRFNRRLDPSTIFRHAPVPGNGAAWELWTDGSCSGGRGAGGYASLLLREGRVVRVTSGGAPETTNNRMEMLAVLTGLRSVPPGDRVTVVSDSEVVVKPFLEGWLSDWRKKGWRGSSGPIANQDLWEPLDLAHRSRRVTWRHVRGHSGAQYNEMCDRLAFSSRARCLRDPWTRVEVVSRPWYDVVAERYPLFPLLPNRMIWGPYSEAGTPCPWPWEPSLQPWFEDGQFACPHCGGMQMAGLPHFDWGPEGQMPDVERRDAALTTR